MPHYLELVPIVTASVVGSLISVLTNLYSYSGFIVDKLTTNNLMFPREYAPKYLVI